MSRFTPKPMSAEEALTKEVLADLRQDLLLGTTSTLSYSALKKTVSLTAIFTRYFNHLELRLPLKHNFTYLSLLEYKYDDLSVYGSNLVEYLKQSIGVILDQITVNKYVTLLNEQLEIFPSDILVLRKKLLSLRKEQIDGCDGDSQSNETSVIDYQTVTYRQVDIGNLSNSIKQISSPEKQIEYFLDYIGLSSSARANLDRLIDHFNETLQNSELGLFQPKLYTYGSLSNGLAAFNSDLDVIIKFEAIQVDLLDFESAMLALHVIRHILQKKLNLKIEEKCLIQSRRCPIIHLDFENCMAQEDLAFKVRQMNLYSSMPLKFNKCDISIRSLNSYYNSQLLLFLTKYDGRFTEMTMLLKHWAKKNDLIGWEGTGSYCLTLMIVFFLQNTNPAIIPSIESLQKLAKSQPGKKPIKIQMFNYEFCDDIAMIGTSNNHQSTTELIVEFFKYYHNFDYRNYGICPRLGKAVPKEAMCARNRSIVCDVNSNFNRSYAVVEDPFAADNNAGNGFNHSFFPKWKNAIGNTLFSSKLTPENAVQVLTREKSKK